MDFADAWSRAVTAELCWIGPDEVPDGLPVTPLLVDGVPCVALPYLRADVADELRAAVEVGFAVTDARSARSGEGVAAVGAVNLMEDLSGRWFADTLLAQELVKYPPARALADTALLRRENWWWLPRVVVRLRQIERVTRLPVRTRPAEDALLVRADVGAPAGLRWDVVRSAEWNVPEVSLAAHDGASLYGDGAAALAMGYHYTVPDLERWEPWARRGALRGDRLSVDQRRGDPTAPLAALTLRERWRRHRQLRRSCENGVREAERRRR